MPTTVTEKLWTDTSTFNFTNSTGANAGGWGTSTNAGFSGGTANLTSVIGDKVTITWSGRSLYLFSAQAAGGCNFAVTTDGVTHPQYQTSLAGTNQSVFRTPLALERNITDGPHTTVLQSTTTSGLLQFFVNSVMIVSGTRIAAGTGKLVACGDSWSQGSGGPSGSAGYPYQVQRRISSALQRDIALIIRGISGAGLANKSNTGAVNAIQQIALANGDAPEFLTLGFGVNDLATSAANNVETPGQFAEFWRTTLMFCSDVFDTSSVKVIAGTPGYVSPAYRFSTKQTTGTLIAGYSGGLDNYEMGVNLARAVFSEFSWLKVADIYTAMDRRTALVYPNGNGPTDFGLHPNEAGHSVVADEWTRALIS